MQEHYGGLKGHRNRRAYQKLDSGDAGGSARRNKMKLRGGWRQRLWRVKVSPKLKILQVVSPKRLFAWICQAYTRTMFGFADKLGFNYGQDEFHGIRGAPRKDYDERRILYLLKVLVERNHRYAAVGSEIDRSCGGL